MKLFKDFQKEIEENTVYILTKISFTPDGQFEYHYYHKSDSFKYIFDVTLSQFGERKHSNFYKILFKYEQLIKKELGFEND